MFWILHYISSLEILKGFGVNYDYVCKSVANGLTIVSEGTDDICVCEVWPAQQLQALLRHGVKMLSQPQAQEFTERIKKIERIKVNY